MSGGIINIFARRGILRYIRKSIFSSENAGVHLICNKIEISAIKFSGW
jgi:hypothetical protein